jgi:Holliday junction resolvasome RuvABC endonuclease subunit
LKGINIIGVDPSLTNSGIVLIACGVLYHYYNIKTNSKMPYGDRLARIALDMNKFCTIADKLKIKIHAVAIEAPFVMAGRMGNSALKVAEARGALIGGIASHFQGAMPPIISITPLEAKKAVGITKQLKRVESKQAVKEAIAKIYPSSKIYNQDVNDAIAVAIAGAKKFKTEETFKKFIF